MKIKAACIGTPDRVADALSSPAFASDALTRVVGIALGVKDVLLRPAEYYVQDADRGPTPQGGGMGVEVRLSGASRDGRTPKILHGALKALVDVVKETVLEALEPGQRCHIFCVIMLDGQIETDPNSGVYSTNLESSAQWIERADTED